MMGNARKNQTMTNTTFTQDDIDAIAAMIARSKSKDAQPLASFSDISDDNGNIDGGDE